AIRAPRRGIGLNARALGGYSRLTMTSPPDPDRTALRLAERLIQLLDRGGFNATYKYAVLIALTDLCMELTGATGLPPEMITTWQLAEKVIELYWPQCAPYDEK